MNRKEENLLSHEFCCHSAISIIIPCFNEADGVELLKSKLDYAIEILSQKYQVQIIIIDDGSSDSTYSKLIRNFGQAATIVKHQTNLGLTAAIQTGLGYASGDIISTMDSDCTYDPVQISGLLELLSTDVDIVTASPYHPLGKVKNVPGWRLFFSKGLSMLYGLVLPQRLYTYTSMFRVYRREIFEVVKYSQPGFMGVTEVLAEAMLSGFKVVEYPATLTSRVYGQSKLRTARMIRSHLLYLGKLIIRRFLLQRKSYLQTQKNSTLSNYYVEL